MPRMTRTSKATWKIFASSAMRRTSVRISRRDLLPNPVDLGPQGAQGVPLDFGERFQCLLVADAGEVSVDLPVLKGLGDQSLGLARARLRLPRPESQVGLEPGEGLISPAGL